VPFHNFWLSSLFVVETNHTVTGAEVKPDRIDVVSQNLPCRGMNPSIGLLLKLTSVQSLDTGKLCSNDIQPSGANQTLLS
jgi:hypothetical protein